MHALLGHFEAVGFDGAPRFVGLDERGREVLSFVEGEPALKPVPAGDGVVRDLGRLLRRMHDAQAGFALPDGVAWPADLPVEVAHVDVYPAWPLFPLAERIVTAAGCNAVRQLAELRDRHHLLPFARRFDDQFQKSAKAIMQSKAIAACFQDPAFGKALDGLVGPRP